MRRWRLLELTGLFALGVALILLLIVLGSAPPGCYRWLADLFCMPGKRRFWLSHGPSVGQRGHRVRVATCLVQPERCDSAPDGEAMLGRIYGCMVRAATICGPFGEPQPVQASQPGPAL